MLITTWIPAANHCLTYAKCVFFCEWSQHPVQGLYYQDSHTQQDSALPTLSSSNVRKRFKVEPLHPVYRPTSLVLKLTVHPQWDWYPSILFTLCGEPVIIFSFFRFKFELKIVILLYFSTRAFDQCISCDDSYKNVVVEMNKNKLKTRKFKLFVLLYDLKKNSNYVLYAIITWKLYFITLEVFAIFVQAFQQTDMHIFRINPKPIPMIYDICNPAEKIMSRCKTIYLPTIAWRHN